MKGKCGRSPPQQNIPLKFLILSPSSIDYICHSIVHSTVHAVGWGLGALPSRCRLGLAGRVVSEKKAQFGYVDKNTKNALGWLVLGSEVLKVSKNTLKTMMINHACDISCWYNTSAIQPLQLCAITGLCQILYTGHRHYKQRLSRLENGNIKCTS